MTKHLPLVEAAILYDQPYAAPFYANLLEALNAKAAAFGASLVQTNASGEGYVTFRTDRMYVLISFNRTPLAPDGFKSVLEASFTHNTLPDAALRVAKHTCNIFITVGDGKTHLTPELREMTERYGVPTGAGPVDVRDKIYMLHATVQTILSEVRAAPTAIHWCQSDILVTPNKIPDLTKAVPFPVTLVTRPEFYDAGEDVTGRQRTATIMVGADIFCGKAFVCDATTLDPNSVITMMTVLLLGHIIEVQMLEDGKSGSCNEQYAFTVRHKPPSGQFPDGAIAVIVEETGAPAERHESTAAAASAWNTGRPSGVSRLTWAILKFVQRVAIAMLLTSAAVGGWLWYNG
ncbi:hypothetical protein [Frigidibacter sp. SD6-1]|uniref:hypothetical protein n=1 Tax=Frigidibacter sp. SD6-1 TaxID=3032581 RepID=UPI0024E03045|nr:hypothetical protein [Frigidibacter sp. SD6-1]